MNIAVGHLTSIIFQPSNLLPVFFLILQEHPLVLKVLSDFDNYVLRIVDLASNVEGL